MFQTTFFYSEYRTVDILLNVLLFLLSIWYIQFLWNRRKLYMEARKIPGPFAWPLIGSGLDIIGKPEDILNNIVKLIEPYSETTRIWLGSHLYLITYDPKIVGILSTKCLERDDVIKKAEYIIGDGLFIAPEKTWKKTRKLIAPTFNQRILDSYVELFNRSSEILTEKLEKFSGKGEIDIHDFTIKCTLDTTCEALMGVRSDFQTSDSTLPKVFDFILKTFFMRATVLWYRSDFLFQFSKLSKKLKQAEEQLHSFTGPVVEERMKAFELKQQERELGIEQSDNGPQWIDHLMETFYEEKSLFTHQKIRNEVDNFLIAATDTTANALCFCFTMLGMYPEMQEKLYREVLDVIGPDRPVEPADLAQLKYMDLFIKETLRIFSAGPFFLRAVKEDVDLGDFTAPKGSTVIILPIKLHMNEKHWPDPLKFRPERFLPEEKAKRHPCAYIPFMYGPRNCIGQRYAMMHLKVALSILVRKFKFFTSYKKIEDIEFKCHLMLHPKNGFKVSMELR